MGRIAGESIPDSEKIVLVLANSVRSDPSRCVAGREVVGDRFEHWIRPVSPNGSGEVSYSERTLTNGHEVAVLDVVRMPLAGRVPDALQPENWAIKGKRTWTLVRRARFRELEELSENPRSIWNEPNARNDSISEDHLRRHPVSQSLYLIKPIALKIQFYTNDFGKRRRRAVFQYGREQYDLAITDPMVPGNYGARYPQWPAMREHDLRDRCYVCVSLAHGSFRGRHYKLVATIIDPDHVR